MTCPLKLVSEKFDIFVEKKLFNTSDTKIFIFFTLK